MLYPMSKYHKSFWSLSVFYILYSSSSSSSRSLLQHLQQIPRWRQLAIWCPRSKIKKQELRKVQETTYLMKKVLVFTKFLVMIYWISIRPPDLLTKVVKNVSIVVIPVIGRMIVTRKKNPEYFLRFVICLSDLNSKSLNSDVLFTKNGINW